MTNNLQELVGKFKLAHNGSSHAGFSTGASAPTRNKSFAAAKSTLAVKENGSFVEQE